MDFSITKQHQLLRKSFVDYLKKRCDFDSRREWISSENGFSQTVWEEISELGWAGLPFDEKYGGLNGSFFEMFFLFEQLGAFQLCTPLFTSSILTGMVLNEAGSESQKQFHLSRLSDGDAIYAAAYPLQDNYNGVSRGVKAVPVDATWHLTGTCLFVQYAPVAEKILVLADLDGGSKLGPTLFLVDPKAGGTTVETLETLGAEKAYTVRLEGAPVEKENIIGDIGKGHRYINNVLPKAMVLKCAEMTGGLQAVMEMTVAYAKQRYQFNKPLGALQIIQHYCADMFTDLEGARLLGYQAAHRINDGLEYRREAAMAKAWCSDVYTKSCLLAHQIFGANGFTEEYDLHLYTKHAKVSELMFGHAVFHRSAVADALKI
jgi:alkylation response protein AidB-like acyl-CoA dehydrogenase